MKRIAVFCALPPDRNTGMATVDLAAFSVVKRLAPHAEITLYTYGEPGQKSYHPGDLPYSYLDVKTHAERYFSSDIFLFWGDFMHARSYWLHDREMSPEQFEDYAKYVFLTALESSRLADAIVFGGTIITGDAADQNDTAYYAHFTRLFEGAGAAYLRDALSAAKISPLRGSEATLGCDPAFLLENADLNQISGFKPATQRQGVGVFFSRTPSKIKMMLFARIVGKYLGEKCAWLPWLEYPYGRRRDRWPLVALGFWIKSGHTDTGAILSQLSGYKYIVTDTYHVCVNAWRIGIPAVCIGEGARVGDTSLGDKKKEILYEMVGARPFYVFIERLRSLRYIPAEAKRAAATLADKALVSQVSANISQHRSTGLRRLSDALQKIGL